MNHREAAVAHPDPTAPMAGTPKFPKIRTQLAATFSRLPATTASRTGATVPSACNVWR